MDESVSTRMSNVEGQAWNYAPVFHSLATVISHLTTTLSQHEDFWLIKGSFIWFHGFVLENKNTHTKKTMTSSYDWSSVPVVTSQSLEISHLELFSHMTCSFKCEAEMWSTADMRQASECFTELGTSCYFKQTSILDMLRTLRNNESGLCSALHLSGESHPISINTN